jgi:uncharacterized membrane protein YccC
MERVQMWHWSREAAIRAVRAAIVISGLFAITDQVVGNLQVATFTAFGGFATLVLASFGGSRRDRLIAHAALAATGSVLLIIGTAVSGSAVAGALVTVPVAFTVFFAGIAGPNAASAATATLLAYVLPAASPGTMSMVPDRLAGWLLASAAGTAVVLLTSPGSATEGIRNAASALATALADGLEAALEGKATEQHLDAALGAKHELLARWDTAPSKPVGLAAPDEALAGSVELLQWCTSMVADTAHERLDLSDAADVDRELLGAAVAVLRDAATLLAGGRAIPDLDRIELCRRRSRDWLVTRRPEGPIFREEAQVSFHANAIAGTVRTIGADALVAAGVADAEWFAQERRLLFAGSSDGMRPPSRASRLAAVARRDASLRSVWTVNSLRGAIALAAAVAVADVTSVQHGFWVVFGTLSVLRTNAASTGATALRALTGTAIGFAIGGALLVAIGSSTTALWAVLPIAVLVTAYAPGTLPFAVAQAAFTVTIAVLFNLLVPVGWRVGVVRIEDVAIGCAVSVVVGSLVWPHGVSALVGDDLADAFRSGAAYLKQAVAWASGSRTPEADNAIPALNAGLRLGDALRGLLAEQGTRHIAKADLWRLVGGSLRLRLTANAVAGLPRDAVGDDTARGVLERRAETLTAWYERLAELVAKPRRSPIAALAPPRFAPGDVVDESSGSHYGVWLCEYMDHLAEHLSELVEPATKIAEMRRRPWWR